TQNLRRSFSDLPLSPSRQIRSLAPGSLILRDPNAKPALSTRILRSSLQSLLGIWIPTPPEQPPTATPIPTTSWFLPKAARGRSLVRRRPTMAFLHGDPAPVVV